MENKTHIKQPNALQIEKSVISILENELKELVTIEKKLKESFDLQILENQSKQIQDLLKTL
jgi:hypothetical protein